MVVVEKGKWVLGTHEKIHNDLLYIHVPTEIGSLLALCKHVLSAAVTLIESRCI